MTEFIIKKDQISRLKVLSDYIKKMENFSPIAEKHVFILNKNKLLIYGIADTAGAGHIEAAFDVDSKDELSFSLELSKFITYLEKTKSDEINISIANDKMTVKSKTSKIVINQALISSSLDAAALKEIQNNIKTKLALPEFKAPIEISLTSKDVMTDLANVTKLQDTNHQIMIGKNYIKTADNLCIISAKEKSVPKTEEILIDRDIISLFKNVDSFKISSDKKFFYFDIANYGIQIIFVPKTFSWTYPTEQDLDAICPVDTKLITTEINTKKFFEVISEFDGVFDSTSWRYSQVNFRTPKGFKKNKEIELFYDNMEVEIRTVLPVEITADTDGKDDFEFIIPTQHFKILENMLNKYETFTIKYSSTKMDQPNGISIIIENPDIKAVVAKMLP